MSRDTDVQEFYDLAMVDEDGSPAGWMTALQTAVTSIVLLWSMRAGRNITSIPFAVSMDTDSEGWFSAPTLYQSSVGLFVQLSSFDMVTMVALSVYAKNRPFYTHL